MRLFTTLPELNTLISGYLDKGSKNQLRMVSKDWYSFLTCEHLNNCDVPQLMKFAEKHVMVAKEILLTKKLIDKLFFSGNIVKVASYHVETTLLLLTQPNLKKLFNKDPKNES